MRRWAYNEDTTGGGLAFQLIKDGYFGGAFTAVPSTKSVSLRQLIRIENNGVTDFTQSVAVALGMKAQGTFSGTSGNGGYLSCSGYYLIVGNYAFGIGGQVGSTSGYSSTMQGHIITMRDNGGGSFVVDKVVSLGGFSENTWYNIRLDVTAVVDGYVGDTITAYRSTVSPDTDLDPDDDDWEELGSLFIDVNTISYRPWGQSADRYLSCYFGGRGGQDLTAPVRYIAVDKFRGFVVNNT
jgi:hypothetical protein